MLNEFRGAPAKWAIAIGDQADKVAAVTTMLELLWKGQHDRHGSDDDTKPLNVTIDEARAAVHLAVLIVQWFRSGAISRATT